MTTDAHAITVTDEELYVLRLGLSEVARIRDSEYARVSGLALELEERLPKSAKTWKEMASLPEQEPEEFIEVYGIKYAMRPVKFEDVKSLDYVAHVYQEADAKEIWIGTADHFGVNSREWYGAYRVHSVWDSKSESWGTFQLNDSDEVVVLAAWHGVEPGHRIYLLEEQ